MDVIQTLLGTVLGLAAAYWILATACSYLLEAWNSLRNIRGKALSHYIQQIVGKQHVATLYGHPLIKALHKPGLLMTGEDTPPSYIPAHAFSTALIDIIRTHTKATGALTYQQLEGAVATLAQQPDPADRQLAATLKPLIDNARHDIAESRANMEKWYDDVMERATGWYRRRSMVWLGGIGFVAAACLNIDTIDLARRLMSSADMRHQFEVVAQNIRQNPEQAELAAHLSFARLLPGGEAEPLLNDKRSFREMTATDRDATLEAVRNLMATNVSSSAYLSAAWSATRAGTSGKAWVAVGKLMAAAHAASGLPEFPCSLPMASNRSTSCRFWDVIGKENMGQWGQTEDSVRQSGDQLRQLARNDIRRQAVATTLQQDTAALAADGKAAREAFWSQTYAFPDAAISQAGLAFITNPGDETLVNVRKAIKRRTDQFSDFSLKLSSSAPGFNSFERPPLDGCCVVLRQAWAFIRHLGHESWRLLTLDVPVLGWLITAIMISMGGPYWYDLIGKVSNVRGSGGKPGPGDGDGH